MGPFGGIYDILQYSDGRLIVFPSYDTLYPGGMLFYGQGCVVQMEDKRIRICDIAEELGLSTATVSNVIHGKTNKVSDETVRRVQELLEKRQYIPNMAGILLAQNDSGIIGVVINQHKKYEMHTLEDPFIASSLNNLSAEIEKSGKFMMVKTTTETKEIIKFASMWNLEGLILIGFCQQDYLWLRQHMRIPFAAYDVTLETPERICVLNLDNFDGGVQVGRHFRRLGHKKALCIADNDTFIDHERHMGFCAGFGGAGADFLEIPMEKKERERFYRSNLERLRGYTAVFAVSDYYAVDLIRFLMAQGIRVPRDISVAGFDDAPICNQIYPALTSVRQDGALRAKTAIEKLMQLRSGEETGTAVVLPIRLILRESTCPPKE